MSIKLLPSTTWPASASQTAEKSDEKLLLWLLHRHAGSAGIVDRCETT
jgi:hypothetical protein